jgi:hypothetical protein
VSELPSLTSHDQCLAFAYLAEIERTVVNLRAVYELNSLTSYHQVFAFSKLVEVERTVVNLREVSKLALTNDQARAFNNLPSASLTLSNLYGMVLADLAKRGSISLVREFLDSANMHGIVISGADYQQAMAASTDQEVQYLLAESYLIHLTVLAPHTDVLPVEAGIFIMELVCGVVDTASKNSDVWVKPENAVGYLLSNSYRRENIFLALRGLSWYRDLISGKAINSALDQSSLSEGIISKQNIVDLNYQKVLKILRIKTQEAQVRFEKPFQVPELDVLHIAGLNSVIKRQLVPRLKKAGLPVAPSELIHKVSPFIAVEVVQVANKHSLGYPLGVAASYVISHGLPKSRWDVLKIGGTFTAPILVTKALSYLSPMLSNAPYIKLGINAAFVVLPIVNGVDSSKSVYKILEEVVSDNSDAVSVGVLTLTAAGAFGVASTPATGIALGAGLVTDYAWTAYLRCISSLWLCSQIIH